MFTSKTGNTESGGQKVIYEIKLHRSVLALLWAFAVGFALHAVSPTPVVRDALAELSSNPTITLILQEGVYGGLDIDD